MSERKTLREGEREGGKYQLREKGRGSLKEGSCETRGGEGDVTSWIAVLSPTNYYNPD